MTERYITNQDKTRKVIDNNFNTVRKLFAADSINELSLDGGFNLRLDLTQMLRKLEREQQADLLSEMGVAVLTENCFRQSQSKSPNYFVRLGLTLPEEEFSIGAKRMACYYLK